jgi:hypothetical protein
VTLPPLVTLPEPVTLVLAVLVPLPPMTGAPGQLRVAISEHDARATQRHAFAEDAGARS